MTNLTLEGRSFLDPQSQDKDSTVTVGDNTSVSLQFICGPLKESYLPAVSAVLALIAIENLAFLIAVFLNRSKLKHNNVYLYVGSALIANLVTSALGFYHFVNYYYGFETTKPNSWWAIRKGMTLALSLIMSGNIGLLIYGIEDSTYVVGRSFQNHQKKKASMDPKFRRRKAMVLIILVWALPTIYGFLAMSDWNCTRLCTCTLSFGNGKAICPSGQCSRLYTPMSKSYLLVVFLLWALECFGLLILLINSICKVRRAYNGNMTSSQKKISIRKTLAVYNASHRVVFALFGLFVACSAPVMILFILDFAFDEITFSPMLVNFMTPLPMIYCLISPILVTQRLSGLKSAILMTVSVSRRKVTTRVKARGGDRTHSVDVADEKENGNFPNGTHV